MTVRTLIITGEQKMGESRLLYNHVVDSLKNKYTRDTIRSYVDNLEKKLEVSDNTLSFDTDVIIPGLEKHAQKEFNRGLIIGAVVGVTVLSICIYVALFIFNKNIWIH